MSQVILTFPLNNSSDTTLELPITAQLLDVKFSHGKLMLWIMVDPDKPLEGRTFKVINTGYEIPEEKGITLCYFKTVHQQPFVKHIFEVFKHEPK